MTDIKDQFWQKSFLLFSTSDIRLNIYSDSWVSIIMKLLKSIILANSVTNAERFRRDSDPNDHANVSLKSIIVVQNLWALFTSTSIIKTSMIYSCIQVRSTKSILEFETLQNRKISPVGSPHPLNRPWIMIHRIHPIWMEDYSHRSGQARLMSKEKSSLISTSISK